MKRVFVILIAAVTLFACSEETRKLKEMEREANKLMEVTHAVLNRVNHPDIDANYIRTKYNELKQDSIEKSYEYAVYWRKKASFLADSLNKAIALADSMALIEAKSNFNSLKKKFIYEKDEFRDIGFYSHRNWGKYRLNRKAVTTGLNSHGYIYLKSVYYADDWLFHTGVQIKIEDQVLSSPKVETYDPNHKTDNEGGKIWEMVTYPSDNGIIKAIAENIDKEIKIRFLGREYYYDIVMPWKDKAAIRDCYELSKTIDLLNK